MNILKLDKFIRTEYKMKNKKMKPAHVTRNQASAFFARAAQPPRTPSRKACQKNPTQGISPARTIPM